MFSCKIDYLNAAAAHVSYEDMPRMSHEGEGVT